MALTHPEDADAVLFANKRSRTSCNPLKHEDNCKWNPQMKTSFRSSIYLAGTPATTPSYEPLRAPASSMPSPTHQAAARFSYSLPSKNQISSIQNLAQVPWDPSKLAISSLVRPSGPPSTRPTAPIQPLPMIRPFVTSPAPQLRISIPNFLPSLTAKLKTPPSVETYEEIVKEKNKMAKHAAEMEETGMLLIRGLQR